MAKKVDLTGLRFGRLLVVAPAGVIKKGSRTYKTWECLCDCGLTSFKTTNSLNSGNVRSCGCLAAESQSKRAIDRNTVHGHNRAGRGNQSPTWHSWNSMRKRCLYKGHVSYPLYGGRGITVCEEWKSFSSFLLDMGERPSGKTLDRINVNGNYEPSNCRWATPSEQQKNKRPSK